MTSRTTNPILLHTISILNLILNFFPFSPMITNPSDCLQPNLTCEICFDPFDLENHLPKSLPCCGKSLCRNCLQYIQRTYLFQCPWCKTGILYSSEAIKTNLQLLNIIEEDRKWDRCLQHGESMKLVCLQDKCKLCAYCGLSSECKNHDLVNLNDLKSLSDERVKELEGLKDRVQKCDEIFSKNRGVFEQIISEDFDKQIFELRKAKTKTLVKLNSAFNEKRNIMAKNNRVEPTSLREEVQGKIYEHLHFFKAKDPVGIVQEDLSRLKERVGSLMGGDKEISHFEQHLGKIAPLFRQKEKDFDTLIKNLKGEIKSQKSSLSENLKPKDDEEICVQVSKFKLVYNSGMLQCYYDDMDDSDMVSFKLKDIKEMRRVGLDTEGFDFGEINFKALERIFGNIEKISQVLLVFKPSEKRIPLEKMARLFSLFFGKPQDISDLQIYLDQNVDEPLMMLNALMSQFSGLKDLKFHFDPEEYSLNNREDFVQNLVCLAPRLEKLDINLSDTNFPALALQKIFVSMPNLEEFVLNVCGIKSLDDAALDMMTRDVKNLMPRLRKFKLDAVGTSVTSSFASALELRLKFIPDFSIRIKGPSYTIYDYRGEAIEAVNE